MTSAELITALQASRPVADPTPARSGARDRRRRAEAAVAVRPLFADLAAAVPLVAVPATAVVLLGAAGIAGLLGSGLRPAGRSSDATQARQVPPQVGPDRSCTAPQLKAGAPAADAATPAPTTGPGAALLGPADALGEGRRRTLRRDAAGAADHA